MLIEIDTNILELQKIVNTFNKIDNSNNDINVVLCNNSNIVNIIDDCDKHLKLKLVVKYNNFTEIIEHYFYNKRDKKLVLHNLQGPAILEFSPRSSKTSYKEYIIYGERYYSKKEWKEARKNFLNTQ